MYASLYIHVPFCRGKCAYCAFYSLPSSTPLQHQAWLQCLEKEFARYASECLPLRSIFVGGGTPSLLSNSEWLQLCHLIRRYFTLAPACEWSCESNPDSLTQELTDLWIDQGINRISMGIQSFQPALRKIIGRYGALPQHLPHTPPHVRRNYDLIFNIPGQTPEQWREDLERLLELNPDHVSCYALTLEEGTRLAKELPPLNDDQFLEMWNDTDRILETAGIFRYEISNFARKGSQCIHNREIWYGETYLGCGPAAASFDGIQRRTNPESLNQWLDGLPPETDQITAEERAAEILATGLRTLAGWDIQSFIRRTGLHPLEFRRKQLKALADWGLISCTDQQIQPTAKGLLFHNNLAMELL